MTEKQKAEGERDRLGRQRARPARAFPATRPQAARLCALARALSELDCPSMEVLAIELELSYKTVQRDLQLAQDRLGWPVEYDAKRYGWRLTSNIVLCNCCARAIALSAFYFLLSTFSLP